MLNLFLLKYIPDLTEVAMLYVLNLKSDKSSNCKFKKLPFLPSIFVKDNKDTPNCDRISKLVEIDCLKPK